ncbi:MAG: calcium/sodium antiporter [Thermodesulfobacteriota bacterium]
MLDNLVAGLPTLILIGLIALSIAVLSKGADWMIDGVVQLAERTGLPKIVIGATIISLGTTMPEAFVSVMAAFMGNPGLALGNGVGSIIADTGLVFGLTCVLAAVPINRFILNRTGCVQVGSATLLVLISVVALMTSSGSQPVIHRWVGVLFLLLLGAYMYLTYMWARQSNTLLPISKEMDEGDEKTRFMSLGVCWTCVIGGLIMVVGAARVLVPSASQIAWRIGVPDDVIAATLVALGTSLPELMTAVTSVRKGHPEITVGNIVGADVLNCLFVIGAAAASRPLAVPPNFFYFHFPTMLIVLYSFRVFIFINRSGEFRRWQGFWLLGIYLAYVILQYALNIGMELH